LFLIEIESVDNQVYIIGFFIRYLGFLGQPFEQKGYNKTNTMRTLTLKFIVIILGIILINSCGNKKTIINPDQIVGYWKTIAGLNEYVQFEKADSEYIYSAYTYDRLSSSGTWELEGENLTINFDDGTSTEQTVSFKGDTMMFNNGSEKYTRAILSSDGKTAVAEIGDIEILERVIKNIDVLFSEIEPFSEDWAPKNYSWQKITTEVVLKNEGFIDLVEVANQISKYIVAQGFDIDTKTVSEKISSYKKGNLHVMIRTRASNEPSEGETTFVDVISGIEKK